MNTLTTVNRMSLLGNRRGLLFSAVTCLLVAVTLILFGSAIINRRVHPYGIFFDLASAGLGIWLAILIGYWSKLQQRLDLFELPVWLSLNIYVQVVMNVWLLQRDRVSSIPWLRYYNYSSMPWAVVLFGVALTALWIGYAVNYRRMAVKKSQTPANGQDINVTNTYLVWLVTWFVSIYVSIAGIGSYLGSGIRANLGWLNYFHFVAVVGGAATALLAIRHFRNPRIASSVWLLVVVGTQLVLSLIAGSKVFVLFFAWLVMYYYYARRRLPMTWFLLAGVLMVLLVPVISRYREELHKLDTGAGVSLNDRVGALTNVFVNTISQPLHASFDSTKDVFQSRQGSILNITASALTLHPSSMKFVGPEMIQEFFPQLIPRVFWPGKPLTRSPLLMITTIYGGAATEYSFSSIGLVGDAYRAGGWPTVLIFFLLLGAFSAWIYHHGPQSGSFPGTIMYTTLLSNVLLYDTEISTMLINLIQFGPLLWILVRGVFFSSSTPLLSAKASCSSSENGGII